MPKDKLTPKQERFCAAYIETGNAAEAYRQSYATRMAPKAVASSAKKLMRKSPIRLRIEELKAARTADEHGLTPKQDSFARLYVETSNASEAYRRSYDVSPDTKANTIEKRASELLNNGKVTGRVKELQAELQKRHDVTVDRIVRELVPIAFANMLDYVKLDESGGAYVDLSKLTPEHAAAISEVTSETYVERKGSEAAQVVKRTKFKLIDKLAALEALGRHLGMFTQKVEGTIKHSHQHRHAAETPDDTARWIARVLAGASGRSSEEPEAAEGG